MRLYDTVYFVDKSCIDEGGSKVITSLRPEGEKKNLAILCLKDISKIENERFAQRTNPSWRNQGEFLKFLDKIPFQNEKPVSICDSDTLDIRIVDSESDYSGIETLGKNHMYLTTSITKKNTLRRKKKNADFPTSTNVDFDLSERGIVTGTSELLCELLENPNTPVNEARALLEAEFFPNQCIKFDESDELYARVVGKNIIHDDGSTIIDIREPYLKLVESDQVGVLRKTPVFGIYPNNLEQVISLNLMRDPGIKIVFIDGRAGSGKTLMAYIHAMQTVLPTIQGQRKSPDSIVLYKSASNVGGDDHGFLPGELYEKMIDELESWENVHDLSTLSEKVSFLDLFLHPTRETRHFGARIRNRNIGKIDNKYFLPEHSVIDLRQIGKTRGLTLKNKYIIIDEAQNLESEVIATLISRAGPGSKVLVLGDPYQIDNPRCTPENNGFVRAIKHYMGRPFAATIRFDTNFRSPVSEHATYM